MIKLKEEIQQREKGTFQKRKIDDKEELMTKLRGAKQQWEKKLLVSWFSERTIPFMLLLEWLAASDMTLSDSVNNGDWIA